MRFAAGTSRARVRAFGERATENLLPVEIKVNQTKNAPSGSAPKYKNAPKQGCATNLFSVWPGEDITLKVELPEPLKSNLPAHFIKWDAPNHTVADNETEHTLQWVGINGFGVRVVKITIGGKEFKVHITMPNVGILSQTEAAALIVIGGPIIFAWSFDAKDYANDNYPLGPERDAMRHSYWCSLSVSTAGVTAGDMDLVGTGHEYGNKWTDKQQAFNSTMDLHNNRVGEATNHQVNGLPDKAAIQQDLKQKYANGEMYIWEIPPGAPTQAEGDSEGILVKSNGQRIYP